MRRIALLTLLMVSTEFSMAQTLHPRSPFGFNVDYARFRYDDSKAYVELYYSFYPSLLTFDYQETRYAGFVKIWTTIRNKATKEEVVHETALLPVSVKDTSDQSFRRTFVSQAGYAVPFGEYELEVKAMDSLGATRQDQKAVSFPIKALAKQLALSDLELCSNITSSADTNDPFYKNSLEVIPNPTLLFGAANHPILFSYFEVYNITPEKVYTVRTSVHDAHGKIVREHSKNKKYTVRNAVEAGTVNVGSVESGRYHLRILMMEDSTREVARVEKVFYVFNPHIIPATVDPSALTATELSGLTGEEMDKEFRMAQYVATDDHKKTYAKLTAESAKREFLGSFWSSIQEGTPLRPGIKRADYLRRVGVARDRYKTFSREGWQTDRGRVFILFAEPDEIERYPSPDLGKPYEIWHYYQIENGVQFVFIDRSGFGDFNLVHSTKRGELSDEQWTRFLQ